MQDIQVLAQQAELIQITHIYRKANIAADWFLKLGHSITDTWSSTDCDSLNFKTIVQDDRMWRTLVRRGT